MTLEILALTVKYTLHLVEKKTISGGICKAQQVGHEGVYYKYMTD